MNFSYKNAFNCTKELVVASSHTEVDLKIVGDAIKSFPFEASILFLAN